MSPAAAGAELLDDLRTFVGRFVAAPLPEALDAIVLWAAHAHMSGFFYTSPRLALLSPEPGSGKTRVLEVLYPVVARPMFSFSASPAAIFRKLAQEDHTLLFDEVDTIFTRKGKDDGNEDLRALLNAGYRRGATIPRCVGPRHEVQEFGVFAPVALAGLGDLPDTIMTRSVIVRMRRRAPSERIEQFRMRIHEPQGAELRDRLAAWAEVVGPQVGEAWPELPAGVVDRDAEIWEPLLAVADAAGGHWPATARGACVELLKVASDREVSLGVRLLGDLRTVFGTADALATSDILEALNELDEAPWGDLYGKKLEPRTLARMLKRYGVTSTTVKIGGKALRGYRRESLWDTWERYLAPASGDAQPPQPPSTEADSRVSDATGQVAPEPYRHATEVQPPQPTRVAQVAHVAEAPREVQPQTRVLDGAPAEVAEVALMREPGRPLEDRAAHAVAELRRLDLDDLRTRYATAADRLVDRLDLPSFIRDTAKAEPVQVTATLELIAEDSLAGSGTRPWPVYLSAARDAFSRAKSGKR
jgi:hypothetical protein